MKIILVAMLIAVTSCKAKTNNSKMDTASSKTIISPPLNIYIDSLNNFKISYPENWTKVNPTSSKTVFKMGNVDSLITLSVNVQDREPSIDNLPLSDAALEEKTKVLVTAYTSLGEKIIKLKVLNYDIGTRKVIATIWYHGVKISENNNTIYVSNDFEFNNGDKRYSISLKGPVKYLDEKISMYYIEKYVESFRILNESQQTIKNNREEQRNEDGLLLQRELISKTIGLWSAKGTAKSIGNIELTRINFQFKFKKDATGEMKLFLSTLLKGKEEALSFSFHIYPWGIVNNKSNADVIYLVISDGQLVNSTISTKSIEKNISEKLINSIQKTRGFTAAVSSISSRQINLKNIEPTGFYPNSLTKE